MSSRGFCAAIGGELVAQCVELGRRELRVLLGRLEVGILRADEPVGQRGGAVPVLLGDADHLADRLHRQLGRDVQRELDLVAPVDRLDDPAGALSRSNRRAS